ncbi:hypothetical protein ACOMHN_005941 [Nucella lapillus]
MALEGGHKICLWLIILGCLAVLTGSASPFWIVIKVMSGRARWGIWYVCLEIADNSECDHYHWDKLSFDDFKAWFYVFHVAAGLTTLICLAVGILSFQKVCNESDSAKNVAGLALSTDNSNSFEF